MPEKVTPTCKYGHGKLLPASEGDRPIQWIAMNIKNTMANPNRGFSFVIFQCPVCSYLELHDDEKL